MHSRVLRPFLILCCAYACITPYIFIYIYSDAMTRRTYADGYSILVEFGGYSSTHLCTRYTRTAPIDGHAACPLTRDWYAMCE